jgi:uncharacterized protein YbjQ (UPF0145 family)
MALSMQVSFSRALDDKRTQISIGRVKATTGWRAARGLVADFDREIALRALVREAEEYGADALVEVSFEIEEVRGPDIDGVPLRRVTATGTAVRLAVAA